MRVILFVLLLLFVIYANAAGQAGLQFTTYRGTGAQPNYSTLTYPTPLSTGVSPTINYSWGGGYILTSGRTEQVIVKWDGYINLPTNGTQYLGGNADDGLIIKVNNTTVLNSWYEDGGNFRYGSIILPAGVYPIEVWYYENGGGAVVNLQWYNGTSWQLVPSSMLATDATFWQPVAPSAVYSNYAITSTQQNRVTAGKSSNTTGHTSIVEVNGDDNVISIQQIGTNGHYTNLGVSGNVNNINILQTSTTGRHYMEATVSGSNNNVILQQRDSDKIQIINVSGNSNTVSTNQRGAGNHFLDLSVSGNNHTAGIVQDGAGNHNARVILDGSQPWNFQLNQNGSTGKNYNLPHSMTDGSAVSGTCSTVGGCNLTINQQ